MVHAKDHRSCSPLVSCVDCGQSQPNVTDAIGFLSSQLRLGRGRISDLAHAVHSVQLRVDESNRYPKMTSYFSRSSTNTCNGMKEIWARRPKLPLEHRQRSSSLLVLRLASYFPTASIIQCSRLERCRSHRRQLKESPSQSFWRH